MARHSIPQENIYREDKKALVTFLSQIADTMDAIILPAKPVNGKTA